MKNRLLAEFPPVATEQWEEVIAKDLKGADYDKKLVWRSAEGFNVRPYYRAEDLKGLRYLCAGVGEFPYVRSTGADNHWLVMQTIAVTESNGAREANATARKAIAAGAEAIGFHIDTEIDDLAPLIDGIDLGAIEVTLGGKHSRKLALAVLDYADAHGLDRETTRINVLCAPKGEKCVEKIKEVVERGAKYKKMRLLGVAGHEFGNAGATIVEELAFTLAKGHDYVARLTDEGVDATTAARTIRFSMSVSSNYFMEIAKLRAARMLWATIMRAYLPECACAEKMFIHAVSSRWNMTVYDPYVNMLRGTTEAMSAAIGGVHSLEVLPFDAAFQPATEFSARIARNVQLLLKHESHFDNVVDPSGGSYYIETLTESIAEQAWALFKQVEEMGGYIAAFAVGFIQQRVEASAAKKYKDVATRKIVLLGTNQYPNFSEIADAAVTEETVGGGGAAGCACKCGSGADVPRLHAVRGAMQFEQLRLRVDRSGREPKVFMLTAGSLGMARARAQFASNFFGCAGFRIIDNTFFASVREGIDAALAARAEIVVLCAADDDYVALAPEAHALLGVRAVLVVAGAPASQPELEAQGIGNFISMRSNVLETLAHYAKVLGI